MEPPVAVKPALTPITDTELSSLRSKMKFVKPRAPRQRGVRIILLLLLVLIAALVGGYLMLNSLHSAAADSRNDVPKLRR